MNLGFDPVEGNYSEKLWTYSAKPFGSCLIVGEMARQGFDPLHPSGWPGSRELWGPCMLGGSIAGERLN